MVTRTTWVEDIDKEPITWAVQDYLPRRVVSSLYGPRNVGKTLAAVWFAIQAAQHSGCRVWFNSREDDLATVLKPRFDATDFATRRRIRLTDNLWRLPADLGNIERELREHRAGKAPDDVLILDSIQQHVERPYHHTPAEASIVGLRKLAGDFNMAVLLIGHTTKGRHATVEAMIAGATVLQNMSKAIYVFGPEPFDRGVMGEPDDDANHPRFVIACERMGVAPKPVSILLERATTPGNDPVTGRPEPFLRYVGPSEATAVEVIVAAKTDERGGSDAGKTAQAAYWMMETLSREGPMPTKDFEARAKGDGVFGSRNTFDRARKIAGVETHKRGNQWWVCLRGQWDDGANSPNSPGDAAGGLAPSP